MNEGLGTGMVWGLEVKKTDLVNIKNIEQAALGVMKMEESWMTADVISRE